MLIFEELLDDGRGLNGFDSDCLDVDLHCRIVVSFAELRQYRIKRKITCKDGLRKPCKYRLSYQQAS